MNKRWLCGLLVFAGLGSASIAMAVPPRPHPPTLGEVRQAADTAYSNGDAAMAMRDYLDLTRARAADSVVWTRIGNLYTLQHDDARALAAYRQAVRMNPADTEALHNLGMLRVRQGLTLLEQEGKVLPAGAQSAGLQCTLDLLKLAMGNAGQGLPPSCASEPAVAASATPGAQ